jgi:hypothetical protein
MRAMWKYLFPLGWIVIFSMGARAEALSAETAPPGKQAVVTDAGRPTNGVAKYDLKYKFAPGETMRAEVVHRATVQTTVQGTSQTAESSSRSLKVWKVEDVSEEGTVTFQHMVAHIDMWQRTTGRQEVRYNSDTDKEVPPGYEGVADAVGVPLSTVTMDARGKIIKRKEHRDQPMGVSTQMTMPLPDDAIAMGESWSSPLEIEVTQKDGTIKKIQTRQKFTLDKVADEVATIKVDSQILTPVNDPAIEAQLIQRLSQGTVQFDIAAGRVISQQLDLDRRVIGFSGAASSMHYVTRFTEKLLPPAEQTARRPKE